MLVPENTSVTSQSNYQLIVVLLNIYISEKKGKKNPENEIKSEPIDSVSDF